jgi:S-adenosylmethionine-dependent methyltransferase
MFAGTEINLSKPVQLLQCQAATVHHSDINFDTLADRFERNIYGGIKGAIRLAVIEQDLRSCLPSLWASPGLRVLDAGGGLGHFACLMAGLGHAVTWCDISAILLERARQRAAQQQIDAKIAWCHQSIQEHALCHPQRYDVVLCHAVLEWTAAPDQVVAALLQLVRPGGVLSLMFYNRHALIYRNLLRGNFRKLTELAAGQPIREGATLTPINPLEPNQVKAWLHAANVELLAESGVRVFADNMLPKALQNCCNAEIIAQELRYASVEPYRQLARYYHVMVRTAANLSYK